jgi:hypothetical protein
VQDFESNAFPLIHVQIASKLSLTLKLTGIILSAIGVARNFLINYNWFSCSG